MMEETRESWVRIPLDSLKVYIQQKQNKMMNNKIIEKYKKNDYIINMKLEDELIKKNISYDIQTNNDIVNIEFSNSQFNNIIDIVGKDNKDLLIFSKDYNEYNK